MVLDLFNAVKQVLVQPIISNGPIVPLDIRVLLGLARLNMLQADVLLRSPNLKIVADILRPVVETDDSVLSTPFYDLLKRPNHPFGRQGEVDLDAEAFAIEVVDHVEQTEAAPSCSWSCMKSMDQT